MARARGLYGERLDAAVGRVESVVVRVLRAIAGRVARLVGDSPSAAALSDDDLQVIRRDWGEAVTAEIVPTVANAFIESAGVLAKEFADAGRPVEVLSLEAPAATDFLDAATNRLVGVADTLWEVARRELADGVRAGEGIEELAARLQEAGGFGETRARTIARTEVVAAANAASLAQALRLGDSSMVKEWLDSDDTRVREAHEDADGQTVPIGEPFEVGGEWLMYPGQPTGTAANVINERCGLGYSWDEQPITAAAEVRTGAMVALRPSAEDADRLAVEGGEPADQLHCTLAYLGDVADIPPDVQQALVGRLTALVEDAIRPDFDLPMQVEGFALDVFNPPGTAREDGKDRDTCIVLGLSGGDLDTVHSMVVETVAEVFGEAGLVLPDQHTPWIPHTTLIYTDDVGRVTDLVDRAGPVTFDAIRVAFGGHNTDIPLTPVEPAVAAAIPEDRSGDSPEHVGGVDLTDSGMQVDAWGDGAFSITDPNGDGIWLDEDEANSLIDALNQVRSGGAATTIDIDAGGLDVARAGPGGALLVPQNKADGWSLTDNDAYDLSYWLAYWLDRGGYYDDEAAEAVEDPAPLVTATARPWDPLKHPRGPDGRFISKGIVGRVSGDTGKSKASRRTAPPATLPPRPAAPEDPQRAELSRLRVAELRQRARDRGLKPGRARKAQLVDMLTEPAGGNGDDTPTSAPAEEPAVVRASPAVPVDDLLTDDPDRRTAAAQQIYGGDFAGFTTSAQVDDGGSNAAIVTGTVRDPGGRQVGTFTRTLVREPGGPFVAYHTQLTLDPDVQGQGFAKAFNAQALDWYRSAGVDRIELQANDDVGGYSWARQGFDFKNERAASRVLSRLRKLTDNPDTDDVQRRAALDLLDRADRTGFGNSGFPTAYEVSQVGRQFGMGRDDRWAGKEAMLDSSWAAVRPVAVETPAKEKLDSLGGWHDEWVAAELPAASEVFDAAGRLDGTDYPQHHVDIDADGAAQDRFTERADEIMTTQAGSPSTDMPSPSTTAVPAGSGDEALAAGVRSGVADRIPLGGGQNNAGVDLATFNDGSRGVLKIAKDVEGTPARVQHDAEELAGAVMRALGLRAPATVRPSARRLWMEYADGVPAVAVPGARRGVEFRVNPDYLDGNPDARIMGLADILVENYDRNFGNWLVAPDGRLIPIDHGFAFHGLRDPGDVSLIGYAGMAEHFIKPYPNLGEWADNDMHPDDIVEARRRLAALRSRFERLGHVDWFEKMMARLDVVGEHATGTVRRLT